jgi:hypothetical protein
MDHSDFDRAELPELANYLGEQSLSMRDWCPSCHGQGSIPDPDAPNAAAKATKCERCEGRCWTGAIDLERLLVLLSHHHREITLNLMYSPNGVVVWSAEDVGEAILIQEEDPLHAAYRLGAKVIAVMETKEVPGPTRPEDWVHM